MELVDLLLLIFIIVVLCIGVGYYIFMVLKKED